MKKVHTLIVLRDQGAEVLKFRLSNLQLLFGAVVVAASLVALAVSGWLFWTTRSERRLLEQVRKENDALRAANQRIEQRLSVLGSQLGETEERARKLAIIAGLDNLPASQEVGIGGGSGLSSEEALHLLEDRTQGLVAWVNQIEEQLGENLRLVASTPTIRPVSGLLTSRFGFRQDPFTGERDFHAGADISAPPGTPVRATASGVVVETSQGGPLGRTITLAHGFGFSTLYAHLARIHVTVGQRVGRGQVIGLVGNSGRSTGYHLHYEVRRNGRPVDPLPFMLDRP
jgi:murein DD-endopeptidase MepM/ murein hydrolase activator NlpD